MSHTYDAIHAINKVRDNPALALHALHFFFGKYPHLALQSLKEDHGIGSVSPTVQISIKASDTSAEGVRWFAGEYNVPRTLIDQIHVFNKANRKIDGIKQIRTVMGLGLKEGKDLFEYIVDRKVR